MAGRMVDVTSHVFDYWGSGPNLSGTAMLSQPVTQVEQAPEPLSPVKNQFNIEGDAWSPYQILS